MHRLALHRLALVAALGASALATACAPTAPPPPILESTTSSAVDDGDDPSVVAPDAVSTPALGAREPLVVVTLFTDYQCPHCRRTNDVAQRLVDRWPDTVQVQFRQRPTRGQVHARMAAIAALAAHRQGKFQCLSSALIRTRTAWSTLDGAGFLAFVRTRLGPHCGLSLEQLDRDLGDPRLGEKVDADAQLARDAGVRGTPAVMVNGLQASLWPRAGVPPAQLLNALVRQSLREAIVQREACEREIGGDTCRPRRLVADRIYGNLGDRALTARLIDAH